jgi:hypothetical protein
MSRIALSIALVQLAGLSAPAADPAGDLSKLSDRALVEAYRTAGLALADSVHAPHYPFGSTSVLGTARGTPFDRARAEILRRGKPAVPGLIDLLQDEVGTRRPPDKNGVVVTLTWDVLELLAAIGDARAVPAVAELLDGTGGRANVQVRHGALVALERLTFCSMRRLSPLSWGSEKAVTHPSGIGKDSFDSLDTAARLYRDWLAGEGSDPSRWLALARQRALKALRGDDPDAIYCAANFLFAHGLDAEEVVGRLAKVLGELKPGPRGSSYRNGAAVMPVGNWARSVARYGPLARPHAGLLIRIQKDHGENAWSFYAMLREVGGSDIMAHLFGVLPRISAEVVGLRADPDTPGRFSGSDPRGWWLDSLREVQLACDLWAGRRFNSDDKRVKWWESNRGRTREVWLAENLETVAYQADAGDVWAGWVASEILPDLPRNAPKDYPAQHAAAYRSKWLKDHRSRLKYDPKAEAFRLTADAK